MAVDKNKIIAEATKLIQKGAYDKAIAAYQKILAADPKEVRSLLKVAELHQKKGDDKAAAKAFEKVAETYAEQGFFLKAVAVYKQIVKIDPDEVRVNERLAGLYQQLGLMSDAMGQYQFMAAAHEKAGDGAKLTDVLRRMVELDPENIASSIKLGEIYARSSQLPHALECLRRAADHLKRHNRADEYLKVAERIATLSGGDVALARELAHIYLAKGDTKRALAKLQLCFKADPKDTDTLQLLARAFRDLGQLSKTVSVYKELAHVHDERGNVQEARAVWRKVQEMAPDDEEAASAMGASLRAAPMSSAPPPGPPPGATRMAAAGAPVPRPGAAAFAAPQAAAGPDAIPKLLSETDVYVKYGLHDKALDHLKRVLALDPRCADAHERARDIHVAAGRPEEAGRAAAAAVRALLAQGETGRALEAVDRLRRIAPAHPELPELSAAAGGDEVSLGGVEEELVLASSAVEELVDDDELALAAAGAQEDERVVDEPGVGEVGVDAGGEAEADPLDGDEDLLAAARDSAESDEVVDEAPPSPARGGVPPRRPAPPPSAPGRRPRPVAEPPPAESGLGDEEAVDLSDEIEEADFFVQQGLLEEAREALRNLLAFYPGHAAVQARLAEVERKAQPAPDAARAPAADAGGDAAFDIARELADEIGPTSDTPEEEEFQYSVEDVFNQFKKGVEQTVKKEDSATHYDLGIAYKEMGLLDDAIHEFETALAGNDRRKDVDCLSMIGLCRLAKGEPREAVKAYRRALGSDHLTKDAVKAIHYDLATAYEGAGDREAALYCYQRVVATDAAFREAAKRVAALGGGPGRPPRDDGAAPRRAASPRTAGSAAGTGRPAAAAAGAPKKNIGYL